MVLNNNSPYLSSITNMNFIDVSSVSELKAEKWRDNNILIKGKR
jgi:hypothetical protein